MNPIKIVVQSLTFPKAAYVMTENNVLFYFAIFVTLGSSINYYYIVLYMYDSDEPEVFLIIQ